MTVLLACLFAPAAMSEATTARTVPPDKIGQAAGRPADLSGVRFDRPDQEPLVAELERVDAEIKGTAERAENARSSRDQARQRSDDASAERTKALAAAEAAERRRTDLEAEAEAMIRPLSETEALMTAAAIDSYVKQDFDQFVVADGRGFTERRSRVVYTATMLKAAKADWTDLRDRKSKTERAALAAKAEGVAARTLASELDAERAAADREIQSHRELADLATARLAELNLQAAALWAGIVEIGRRPDPTTTTTAPEPLPVIVNPEDLVRQPATELASGGPLGPLVTYNSFDFPKVVLDAYVLAAATMDRERPKCRLRWELLAGIGKVESYHGRIFGNRVDDYGNVRPGIRGPALDGVRFALIRDTDGGQHDGDVLYDRAVGPMQFIPGSWRIYGRDGNGDGERDPHNIYDAALAAGEHLCRAGHDTGTGAGLYAAILSYNHSSSYAATVLGHMNGYGKLSLPDGYAPIAPKQVGPLPPVVFPPNPTTTSTTGGSSTTSSSTTSTTDGSTSSTNGSTSSTSSTTSTTEPDGGTTSSTSTTADPPTTSSSTAGAPTTASTAAGS